MNISIILILIFYTNFIHLKIKRKNMNETVPCPNQGCRAGKVHYLVGFDIFWDDCPTCGGLGSIKRDVSDDIGAKAES